jgi:hypothetical protein
MGSREFLALLGRQAEVEVDVEVADGRLDPEIVHHG